MLASRHASVQHSPMTVNQFLRQDKRTDADLARLLNVDRSQVHRWRRRKSRPGTDTFLRIVKLSGGTVTAIK